MLKSISLSILTLTIVLLFGCNNLYSSFPVDKPYWTVDDYQTASTALYQLTSKDKELPSLNNPSTIKIFNKIIDTNNIAVVANDNQLGLINRSKFMSDMFDIDRNLEETYSVLDRTDKYQYPQEFASILKFGLYMQLYYIELGNKKIIEDADDPKAENIVSVIKSNQNVLVRNFEIYLDCMNHEDRFDDKALDIYASGLADYFPRLINEFAPEGDYDDMLTKVNNMIKKVKNPSILTELNKVKILLTAKIASKPIVPVS